jgi:hypothetical protein
MTPRDELLHELSGTLRGARRARQRLLDEIAEDLEDAIDHERARGMAPDAAEAIVARRFGTPAVVATLWNREQTMRRRAIRRNMLVLMIAVATAGGLGITQHASGKNSLTATRASRVIRGYGMSLTVPDGWSGRITHGLVRLRGAGLRIEIRESSPTNRLDPFFRRRSVPALRASDFRSAEHHLGFTVAGRHFAVLPFPARPSQAAIDVANSALRSFTVRAGRYYGQPLAPARFPKRPGWFVGARAGKLLAEGGQTETWASTVPYRDAPSQIPPHRTLARLPRDGVIIWVSLSRDSALRQRPFNSLSIRRRLIESSFEGLPKGVALYRASVRQASYDMGVWVFFKTLHPRAEVVARAQAQLDSLRLPSWPSG